MKTVEQKAKEIYPRPLSIGPATREWCVRRDIQDAKCEAFIKGYQLRDSEISPGRAL